MHGNPIPASSWTSGDAYEAYVGRWSALVAPRFVEFVAAPSGRRWLDVGCGTGILTQAILDLAGPVSVVGVDPSEPFVAHARRAVADPRAIFGIGTAGETELADAAVDVVVSGLVLNQVPDVPGALMEARRVAVPGGIVGAYVWDYAGGMQFIRAFWDAAISLDAAAAVHDQARRFPIAAPDPLRAAFRGAGLEAVEVVGLEIATAFADFDDLWTPFTGGTGDAPAYLAALEPDRRAALQARLRASVPIEADGSIHLSARAWACRGLTPI